MLGLLNGNQRLIKAPYHLRYIRDDNSQYCSNPSEIRYIGRSGVGPFSMWYYNARDYNCMTIHKRISYSFSVASSSSSSASSEASSPDSPEGPVESTMQSCKTLGAYCVVVVIGEDASSSSLRGVIYDQINRKGEKHY